MYHVYISFDIMYNITFNINPYMTSYIIIDYSSDSLYCLHNVFNVCDVSVLGNLMYVYNYCVLIIYK